MFVAKLVRHQTFNLKIAGSNPVKHTLLLFLPKKEEEINRKKGIIIKLIGKRELKVLIENGYIHEEQKEGITITSRQKASAGKRYYAEDRLAFIAWEILGYSPDDKDFQKWISQRNRRKA